MGFGLLTIGDRWFRSVRMNVSDKKGGGAAMVNWRFRLSQTRRIGDNTGSGWPDESVVRRAPPIPARRVSEGPESRGFSGLVPRLRVGLRRLTAVCLIGLDSRRFVRPGSAHPSPTRERGSRITRFFQPGPSLTRRARMAAGSMLTGRSRFTSIRQARLSLAIWLLFLLLLTTPAVSSEPVPGAATVPDPAAIEFFENSVRPLLHDACSGCHGSQYQWGGLRVDSLAALIKGGDSDAAIVPGDVESSLLIAAVRRTGDYEMPPEEPLSDDQVAILERWVAMGAPWPADDPARADAEAGKSHWAFQPITSPQPPVPEPGSPAAAWIQTDVDAFVWDKLAQKGLQPSPAADRATWLRRVNYGLTGLPPTAEQVREFVADESDQAYAKVVDRLLDSPQYGEHWARHWLDLARFADTKGYVYAFETNRFVHAGTYRDWLIDAFQNDLPYDRFLLHQLAADQAAPDDPPAQAAMGFLTIGRRFLGIDHDIIDDRLDVVGRTTMGLTFGCARCHDHKYDPIPIDDYYSLYGVFHNSLEQLVCAATDDAAGSPEFQAELKKRIDDYQTTFQANRDKAARRVRDRLSDYLTAVLQIENYPNIPFSQILAENDLFPAFVHRWEVFLRQSQRSGEPIFAAWHRFAALPRDGFAVAAGDVVADLIALPADQAHPLVTAAMQPPPESMMEVAQRYAALLTEIHQQWLALVEQQPEASGLSDPQREALRQWLYDNHSPCQVPDEHIVSVGGFFATGSEVPEIWNKQKAIEQFVMQQPDAPPFAVRMVDKQQIEEPRVFRRGNPMTKGNEAIRQFPLVVAGEQRQPFEIGSGRLELAQGIIDPTNPLTARVWVNRIWQAHFGVGIVPTASDFGTRAPQPQHAQLLDWLATRLIDSGWSTKEIQRLILLSATYRQQSSGPEVDRQRQIAENLDPENELFWRMNIHRLRFEEFRDSMLRASDELETKVGGASAPILTSDDSHRRRTLYGFVDREFLPDVYRVFDFANPDLHVPQRSQTTVSQQSLFALNHPFVANRARSLIKKLDAIAADESEAALLTGPPSDEQRVRWLYLQLFQRQPTPSQLAQSLEFIHTGTEPDSKRLNDQQAAWQYGYGSIRDHAAGIQNFQPLPHFTGDTWQGGPQVPAAESGWAFLTATGGHPGNHLDHAVVRRWTADRDGAFRIVSEFAHEHTVGDGVRGWILATGHGVLNHFTAHNIKQSLEIAPINLNAGDTIDFVVDIREQLHTDQFLWTVDIHQQGGAAESAGEETGEASVAAPGHWNSQRDFTGPASTPLSLWEQLAQVLLLSNEFFFVL